MKRLRTTTALETGNKMATGTSFDSPKGDTAESFAIQWHQFVVENEMTALMGSCVTAFILHHFRQTRKKESE